MSLLRQVETVPRLQPRRVLLYGERGLGLSTFAAALAQPIFVACDDSLAHLECPRFPAAKRLGGVLRALAELHDEPHGYRTVVLDPLDGLELLILDELRREHGVEQPEATPFARAYALALDHWRDVLKALDVLRLDVGMTCVLVGRARVEPAAAGTSAAMAVVGERHALAIHHRASSLIQSWCDEVLFAARNEAASVVPRTREESGDEAAPSAGMLFTTPGRGHTAKNRLGLPARMPMDARALARRLVVPKLVQQGLN